MMTSFYTAHIKTQKLQENLQCETQQASMNSNTVVCAWSKSEEWRSYGRKTISAFSCSWPWRSIFQRPACSRAREGQWRNILGL